MCFNPGDGQLMMPTSVVEEEALNDQFVAAGLDRVVHKEANAVLILSVIRLTRCEVPGACFLESPDVPN